MLPKSTLTGEKRRDREALPASSEPQTKKPRIVSTESPIKTTDSSAPWAVLVSLGCSYTDIPIYNSTMRFGSASSSDVCFPPSLPSFTCSVQPFIDNKCIGLHVSKKSSSSGLVTVNHKQVTHESPVILTNGDILAFHSQYAFCFCTDLPTEPLPIEKRLKKRPHNPLFLNEINRLLNKNFVPAHDNSSTDEILSFLPQRSILELKTMASIILGDDPVKSSLSKAIQGCSAVLIEGPEDSGLSHQQFAQWIAKQNNADFVSVPSGLFAMRTQVAPSSELVFSDSRNRNWLRDGKTKSSVLFNSSGFDNPDDLTFDSAFDGEDSDFNKQLFEDLEDDYTELGHDDDFLEFNEDGRSQDRENLLSMILDEAVASSDGDVQVTINFDSPAQSRNESKHDSLRLETVETSQREEEDEEEEVDYQRICNQYSKLIEKISSRDIQASNFKEGDRVVFHKHVIPEPLRSSPLAKFFQIAPSNSTGTVVHAINSDLILVDFDTPFRAAVGLYGLSQDPVAGAVVQSKCLTLEDRSSLPLTTLDVFEIVSDFITSRNSAPLVFFIHDQDNLILGQGLGIRKFLQTVSSQRALVLFSLPRMKEGQTSTTPSRGGLPGLLELVSGPKNPGTSANSSANDGLPPPVDKFLSKFVSPRIVTTLPIESGAQRSQLESRYRKDRRKLFFEFNLVELRLSLICFGLEIPSDLDDVIMSDLSLVKSMTTRRWTSKDTKNIVLLSLSSTQSNLIEGSKIVQISSEVIKSGILSWSSAWCMTHPTPTTRDDVSKSVSELYSAATKRLKEFSPKDEHEEALAAEAIPPGKISIKFDDIGSLDSVKNDLVQHLVLPLRRPELFSASKLSKSSKGVLLFGPPGTGKTMLGKAVANESGAVFIPVSSASLGSRYFGDSERLARSLFTVARALAPSIIFLDEADAILGSRSQSHEHEANRKIKNVLLEMWDGLTTENSAPVVVLCSTNRPQDLDEAVLRRLPLRLLVDVPSESDRVHILSTIIGDEQLDGITVEELSMKTKGFSGSDLAALCQQAAFARIAAKLEEESQAKSDNHDDSVPLWKSILSKMPVTRVVDEDDSPALNPVTLRPLTRQDFEVALKNVSASVSEDTVTSQAIRKWNETFGTKGGKRSNGLSYFT
ncbi:hypothetical protein RCL1_006826 [Eukaryota sp. TZLM3-RCL]